MRKIYRNALKNHFHINLVQTRAARGLTLSQMAEKLAMDDRSYIDLDHGRTCCSAVTLALYLAYVCEDVPGFVEELAVNSTQPFIKQPEQKHSFRFLILAASYRVPMPVTEMVQYSAHGSCYPLCPRCKKGMDREYMAFCDRCGQKLSWNCLDYAEILVAPINK